MLKFENISIFFFLPINKFIYYHTAMMKFNIYKIVDMYIISSINFLIYSVRLTLSKTNVREPSSIMIWNSLN